VVINDLYEWGVGDLYISNKREMWNLTHTILQDLDHTLELSRASVNENEKSNVMDPYNWKVALSSMT
jgi:hypothetical protein